METFITPDRIANAICMDTSFLGSHVIVEGKKDFKFYSKFFNSDEIKIAEAFGNQNVIKVLEILADRGFDRKLGIIDSDFNKILGITFNIDGLFVTDTHDIEVMVIKTDALIDVVNQYCSSNSIKNFEKAKHSTIRNELFKVGREIGYIKLANKVHDLGLVFKPKTVEGNQLKYNKLISNDFEFLGEEVLIETIVNFSNGKSNQIKSKKDIKKALKEMRSLSCLEEDLVNGHDLTNLLFLLMKKILKSRSKGLNDWTNVEDSLSLAYDSADFKNTQLFRDLWEWSQNSGVTLFNQRITSS